jgi:hypothetical protein
MKIVRLKRDEILILPTMRYRASSHHFDGMGLVDESGTASLPSF